MGALWPYRQVSILTSLAEHKLHISVEHRIIFDHDLAWPSMIFFFFKDFRMPWLYLISFLLRGFVHFFSEFMWHFSLRYLLALIKVSASIWFAKKNFSTRLTIHTNWKKKPSIIFIFFFVVRLIVPDSNSLGY